MIFHNRHHATDYIPNKDFELSLNNLGATADEKFIDEEKLDNDYDTNDSATDDLASSDLHNSEYNEMIASYDFDKDTLGRIKIGALGFSVFVLST